MGETVRKVPTKCPIRGIFHVLLKSGEGWASHKQLLFLPHSHPTESNESTIQSDQLTPLHAQQEVESVQEVAGYRVHLL